ncbi:SDR family oxidoreductase [Maribacter sp. 2307ULW6-5]|uniref:SDR family oxidoreductase n=1 Tax=Maribacter sp. 2307ULW6-5 TaxID=3386275 RepID=UPI0039BCCEE7
MSKLENKTALITGGNSGIGFATAETFIKHGAKVIITGRNEERLQQAVAKLGSAASYIVADSGKMDDLAQLAERVGEHTDKLDVLFLNAGIAKFAPIEYIDESFFDESFNVNVKGVFFTVKHLLPYLFQDSSVILNASINAHIGMPNSSVYAATKAGVISLAKTLSGELKDRGIRVNAISPGPINTPIYQKLGLEEDQLNEMAGHIQSQVPLGRFGNPQEIANAALFLGTDDSKFMLGSELILDGGMSTL